MAPFFLKRFLVGHVRLELLEVIIFLSDLVVTVGFVYSRWRSIVTDGGVDRDTSHVIFLMHVTRVNSVLITLNGSSVCIRASLHVCAIHGERLTVCCVCSSF